MAKPRAVEGAQDFVDTIDRAPEDQRPLLHRLADWAIALEHEGLARLTTVHGTASRWTLLPRLLAEGVGLITIYNERGPYLTFHRTVFERRAPVSLPRIEQIVAPTRVGQGTVVRAITEELLEALTAAYREAAAGVLPEAPVTAG